jgi:hypothetical protein
MLQTDMVDNSSSDDETIALICRRRKRKRKKSNENVTFAQTISLRLDVIQKIISANFLLGRRLRAPNVHRDRHHALEFVRSWSDNEFQCQFRLRREVFATCLGLLNVDLQRNEKMAKNSSGSSISPEMMFLITLRILAGASYLDMIWYRVSIKHVFDAIVFPTLVAICGCLPPIDLNISFSQAIEQAATCILCFS